MCVNTILLYHGVWMCGWASSRHGRVSVDARLGSAPDIDASVDASVDARPDIDASVDARLGSEFLV